MTAEEIREILMKKFDYTEEQVCEIKHVTNLRAELEAAQNRNNKIEQAGIFSTAVEDKTQLIEPTEVKAEEEVDVRPKIGTFEWEEYVLGLLKPGELEEKNGKKYPKASGLRRVAQMVLGPIVSSGPVMVHEPKEPDKPGRATVIYEIQIEWIADIPQGTHVDIKFFDIKTRVFREAADAWTGNTPGVFALHPVATASTRAEGRALRRALQLNTLVAEEMESNPNYVEPINEEALGKMLPHQMVIITQLCGRARVNINKAVQHHYNKIDLSMLTKDEAASFIKLLNEYQQKVKEVPDSIKE